jgi:hypothetical protein
VRQPFEDFYRVRLPESGKVHLARRFLPGSVRPAYEPVCEPVYWDTGRVWVLQSPRRPRPEPEDALGVDCARCLDWIALAREDLRAFVSPPADLRSVSR